MKGFSKSASVRPTARSRLRWGARSYPFFTVSLRMEGSCTAGNRAVKRFDTRASPLPRGQKRHGLGIDGPLRSAARGGRGIIAREL